MNKYPSLKKAKKLDFDMSSQDYGSSGTKQFSNSSKPRGNRTNRNHLSKSEPNLDDGDQNILEILL